MVARPVHFQIVFLCFLVPHAEINNGSKDPRAEAQNACCLAGVLVTPGQMNPSVARGGLAHVWVHRTFCTQFCRWPLLKEKKTLCTF